MEAIFDHDPGCCTSGAERRRDDARGDRRVAAQHHPQRRRSKCSGDPRATVVDTIVTSPPYFGLRSYGDQPDQLGQEAHVGERVEALLSCCGELGRVLKPTGSLWLNLGDSFSRSKSWGASPKSLLLAPERLLLALAREGWVVRNRIVWSKPNPMPTPVLDRLAVSHEDVFLLTRGPRYFFDLDAIRVARHQPASEPERVWAAASQTRAARRWERRYGQDRP